MFLLLALLQTLENRLLFFKLQYIFFVVVVVRFGEINVINKQNRGNDQLTVPLSNNNSSARLPNMKIVIHTDSLVWVYVQCLLCFPQVQIKRQSCYRQQRGLINKVKFNLGLYEALISSPVPSCLLPSSCYMIRSATPRQTLRKSRQNARNCLKKSTSFRIPRIQI